MRTIGILTFILLVATSVSNETEVECKYSKDHKSNLVAHCQNKFLKRVPDNLETDIKVLELGGNYINKLTKTSVARYPSLKTLSLPFNQVYEVDPDALSSLADLEMLDLSSNPLKAVPAGLPKSLHRLYLDRNPLAADMRALAAAVGLHTLMLRSETDDDGLAAYPDFGPLPNLVKLDVSMNRRIADVTPAQLAVTCRLALLNVTGTGLFPAGAHCPCRRFRGWTAEYKIAVTGLDACPDAADGEADDPDCERAPDAARDAFKDCMAAWDRRNTPYVAIAVGLLIAGAVVWLLLCVCVRRRRRRRSRLRGENGDNGDGKPPAADGGDNNHAAAAAPGHDKAAADPVTLLSSSS